MEYMLGLNSEERLNKDIVESFTGVGMIRGENLCINKMQYFTVDEFRKYVENYLKMTAHLFDGKDVWYRTADLVPHQINILDGCDEVLSEDQFLLGLRGIRRNLEYPAAYLDELSCFIKAYSECNNLGILLPFISNPDELRIAKTILKDNFNYDGKIGIMIEIPSVFLLLDEYEKIGVDNYTVGINDLTSLILGAERGNKNYSKSDKAVLLAIKSILEKVHSYGKKLTVAGYMNKETHDILKDLGIDYLNVHYNEIPKVFDVQDESKYTKHYDDIKRYYKRIKNERN